MTPSCQLFVLHGFIAIAACAGHEGAMGVFSALKTGAASWH
jgi:hypothetical protein